MKITALETIQLDSLPMSIWLQVHTDEGIVGLGESAREPATIAEYIHTSVAAYLLGKDPLAIEKHNRFLLSRNVGFAMAKNEARFKAAVNQALLELEASGEAAKIWDTWFGPGTAQPVKRSFRITAEY